MKYNTTSLICLIAFSLSILSINAQTEKFSAGGISFEGPKGWQSQKPSSSMRKAQFVIKDKNGTAEVVFFHFGPGAAGGVKANVERWLGQFKEPVDQVKAKITNWDGVRNYQARNNLIKMKIGDLCFFYHSVKE